MFAGVDWGSSNLRIWLFQTDGTVIARAEGKEGMLKLSQTDFAPVLEAKLSELDAPIDCPVVISGMAGSQQGWTEAPYVDTPCDIKSLTDHAITVDNRLRDIRILPGCAARQRQTPDVMRGEEVQVFGASLLGKLPDTLCIPGTHSKWIGLEGAKIVNFQTFMTGEAFSLLSKKSSLTPMLGTENMQAFAEAVRAGFNDPSTAMSEIFTLRAGPLLDDAENHGRSTLSGWLIGAELVFARVRFGSTVGLIATGKMAELYKTAMEVAGFEARMIDAAAATQAGLIAAGKTFWGSA